MSTYTSPCSMCDGECGFHTGPQNHIIISWVNGDTMTLIPKSLMLHFYHFIKK